ncbi:M24 family metallopeptidase [Eubacterium sp. AF05-24]|uniref:M24 family metallopeptidase n=1 Tax=Eubacterium sp. AF05-24 TaxID=2996995 RepID=UPI0022E1F4EB|nr:aminopeptidase P family protein [Eubacterium sp. AF05-24]
MKENRVNNIRQILNDVNAEAILIKSKTNKRYVGALTGSGVQVLITKTNIYQLMDGRYINEANETTQGFENMVYTQGDGYLPTVKKIINGKPLAIESNQILAKEYIKLQESGIPLVLLDNELEIARKNKDEEEIALVQKACDITDQIFMEAISTIHIGMKEYELSAFLQYLALKNGASGMAFDTIVASGQRGAMPHGRPTDKPFAEHEFITIDFGIVYQGYQSDMTRTVCIGTPDPEVKKIYDIVFEAQCAGVEFIKAGIRGKDVDDYVRSIISNHGYGEYFTHGLGHGMGMGDGELPVLNQRSETILEEGMIMSCEPGIYVSGIGGVRIEDDVLIRNGVGVALNHTPKTLIQLEVK